VKYKSHDSFLTKYAYFCNIFTTTHSATQQILA
jgi:hypothetical protein